MSKYIKGLLEAVEVIHCCRASHFGSEKVT